METINISKAERIGSVAIGSILIANSFGGMKRQTFVSLVQLITGVFLIKRGTTGSCPVSQSLGISTAGLSLGEAIEMYTSPGLVTRKYINKASGQE